VIFGGGDTMFGGRTGEIFGNKAPPEGGGGAIFGNCVPLEGGGGGAIFGK
jgi:hypothetical protein